ncbi:AraC family transcriptional regulator [Chryseobacterium sp. JUb7]|uniref:AraC family transcriptional regulator n=1 Tax=Chryseobacterium sp. JUb7 TaxID=2940599 RepID=UPI00216A5CDA|nr:AraC family transcriptional regulator [Chryseobacterium sp. JUb7]MCS3528975.1 AraC-like DNA-binding protein [Chryseobacterium sp. JUb7]
MKRKQFEPLEIDTFETSVFPFPKHSHTYYEMIYIFKGCGNHHINKIIVPYKAGDLYLISPDDEHFFDIKKSTKFCFIKFNDSYFENNKHLSPDRLTTASPAEIMRNSLLKEEKLIFDEPCKTILRKTVENITEYNDFHKVSDSPIIFFQVLSLFGLIREAAAKFLHVKVDHQTPKKDDLISYIHQNIYSPELIRISVISRHFNISETYFGAYFKRNFDVSYRKYITDYKLKLIERRIQSGQVTMKQIAYEFGFTDESHLTNYFKKQTNTNPSDFKFQHRI